VRTQLPLKLLGTMTGADPGMAPGSIYERLGLKPGDILAKANGFMLGMPPQEMQAFGLLKTATRIDLDIERDGQIIRKTYLLQH
jgi:general secretion pathway protein C